MILIQNVSKSSEKQKSLYFLTLCNSAFTNGLIGYRINDTLKHIFNVSFQASSSFSSIVIGNFNSTITRKAIFLRFRLHDLKLFTNNAIILYLSVLRYIMSGKIIRLQIRKIGWVKVVVKC